MASTKSSGVNADRLSRLIRRYAEGGDCFARYPERAVVGRRGHEHLSKTYDAVDTCQRTQTYAPDILRVAHQPLDHQVKPSPPPYPKQGGG